MRDLDPLHKTHLKIHDSCYLLLSGCLVNLDRVGCKGSVMTIFQPLSRFLDLGTLDNPALSVRL